MAEGFEYPVKLGADDALTPALTQAAKALDAIKVRVAGLSEKNSTGGLLSLVTRAAQQAGGEIGALASPAEAANRLFHPLAQGIGVARRQLAAYAREADTFRHNFRHGLESLGRGLPAVGALGGLATIGGAVAATAQFAASGASARRQAAAIGVSPRDLQRWQGAAEYAGLGRDQTASGLWAIGQHLHDAAYGSDTRAVNTLSDLRLGPARNADGSIRSVSSFLPELLRAVRQQRDPFVQQQMLAAFAAQDFLPLAHEGDDWLKDHMDRAESLGAVMNDGALDRADRLNDAIIGLEQAAKGAAITVGVQLMPVIERMAKWLATPANQEWVGTKVQSFLHWLEEHDLVRLDDTLTSIANTLGASSPGAGSSGAPGAGSGPGGLGGSGDGSPISSNVRSELERSGLPKEAQSFLAALAGGEAKGFNELVGGGTFGDMSRFPDWAGRGGSHAAGLFQDQPGTWQSILTGNPALKDFGPQSQIAGNWWWAQKTYRDRSGRDLLADLRAGSLDAAGQSALLGQWPGGMSGFASRYRNALAATTTPSFGGVLFNSRGEPYSAALLPRSPDNPLGMTPQERKNADEAAATIKAATAAGKPWFRTADDDPQHRTNIRIRNAPKGTNAEVTRQDGPADLGLSMSFGR